MKKPLFSAEELAELARIDAEIDAAPLTDADYRASEFVDTLLFPEREKARARNRAYAARNREKEAARVAEWTAAHKAEVAARKKAWYAANKARIAAQQKAYRIASGRQAS